MLEYSGAPAPPAAPAHRGVSVVCGGSIADCLSGGDPFVDAVRLRVVNACEPLNGYPPTWTDDLAVAGVEALLGLGDRCGWVGHRRCSEFSRPLLGAGLHLGEFTAQHIALLDDSSFRKRKYFDGAHRIPGLVLRANLTGVLASAVGPAC